jgi:hypothetical protein
MDMTKRELILKRLHAVEVPTRDYYIDGLSWYEYKKLANLTKFIDYDCRFNGNMCKAERIDGCCKGCAYYVGHWHTSTICGEHLDALTKYYNAKTGFLRKTGCILPRKYRSPTCLRYMCMCHLTKSEEALMILLSGIATDVSNFGNKRHGAEYAYRIVFNERIQIHNDNEWRIALRAIKKKAMEVGK